MFGGFGNITNSFGGRNERFHGDFPQERRETGSGDLTLLLLLMRGDWSKVIMGMAGLLA